MNINTIFDMQRGRKKVKLLYPTSHFKVIKQGNIEYLVCTHQDYADFRIRRFPQKQLRKNRIKILETPTNIKNIVRILEAIGNCRGKREGAVLINGETGCGKNTLIYYIANLLGQRVRVVSCSEDMEENELAEDLWIKKDSHGNPRTVITPSPTAEGLRGGDIIVWDEANKLRSGVLKKANSIVQDKKISVFKGREVFEAKDSSVIILTGNLGDRYAVEKFSSEFKNRLQVIDIDYLPPAEEKQWLLWRRQSYRPDRPISNEEIDLIDNLTGAAHQIRNIYLGRVEKGNGEVDFFEKGSLISVPLSTASLEKIVEHIAHFPEDIYRIGDIIRRFYHYLEDEDTIKNIEAVLEPRGLLKSDKSGFRFRKLIMLNKNSGKYLLCRYEYKGEKKEIKIKTAPYAPNKVEDVPLNCMVDLTPTNALLITDILKDISLGRHLQFVGEQGTGKDTMANFISYLIQGRIESYGVSENTDRSDLLSYRGIGIERSGEMTEEKASLPRLMVGDGKRGFIGIYQEINSARPKVLGVFNNPLRFGFIELPDKSTITANKGWLIITTRNPYKLGYKAIKRLSLEFEQRFSTHRFEDLPREEKIEIIKKDIKRLRDLYPFDNYLQLRGEFIEKVVDLEAALRKEYPEKLPDPVSLRNIKRLCRHFSMYPHNFYNKERFYQIIDECFHFEESEHKKLVREIAKTINFEELMEVVEFQIDTGNKDVNKLLEEVRKEKDKFIILSKLNKVKFLISIALKRGFSFTEKASDSLNYINQIKRSAEVSKKIKEIKHMLAGGNPPIVREPPVLKEKIEVDEIISYENPPHVREIIKNTVSGFYVAEKLKKPLKVVQIAGKKLLLINEKITNKEITPVDLLKEGNSPFKSLLNFLILDAILPYYLKTKIIGENNAIAKIIRNIRKIKFTTMSQENRERVLHLINPPKHKSKGYDFSNKDLNNFIEEILKNSDLSYNYFSFFKERVIHRLSIQDKVIFLFTLLFTINNDQIIDEVEKLVEESFCKSLSTSTPKCTSLPTFEPLDLEKYVLLKTLLESSQKQGSNMPLRFFLVGEPFESEKDFDIKYLGKKNEVNIWINKRIESQLQKKELIEKILSEVRSISSPIIEAVTKTITREDWNGNLERLTHFNIHNHILYASSGQNNLILMYHLLDQKYLGAITNEDLDNNLKHPRGLEIHNDILYISSESNSTILKYHLKTKRYIGNVTIDSLRRPTNLRVHNNILYISTWDTNSIFMCRLPDGKHIGTLTIEGLKGSAGLDIYGNTLLVSSRWNHLIFKYDLETRKCTGTITKKDLNNKLGEPTHIVVHNDILYICSFLRDSVLMYNLVTNKYLGAINIPWPICLAVYNNILYIGSEEDDAIFRRLLPL